MRIISQDKTFSFEFNYYCIERHNSCIYVSGNIPRKIILGAYKSDKRAEEVFEQIHERAIYENENLPVYEVFLMPKE